MGWTGSWRWKKKGDVVEEIYAVYKHPPLATKSTRNGLWVLAQSPKGPRIDYYLITSSEGQWAYKDMSECMGPTDVDVPVAWLDLAPEQDAAWRERVREALRVRSVASTLEPGAEVEVYGKPYLLVGKQGRSWIVKDDQGKCLRVPTTATVRLQSEARQERAAKQAALDASPFQVTTAWGSWHASVPEGHVGLRLTKGGNREGYGPEVYILVPSVEYTQGGYTYTGEERPWSGP